MKEALQFTEQQGSVGAHPLVQEAAGKVTVFEALAEYSDRVGPSRSNQTTPPAGDADDQ